MLWQPRIPEKYYKLTEEELLQGIYARRKQLGDKLIILGHHYQQDDVIRFADFTGDSFRLSQLAAERVRETGAKYIIFCGVHFMAESADILTDENVQVILPDLTAGCSMADMADYEDTVMAWDAIHKTLKKQNWKGRVIPITYMNSSAAIKAFCGEHGGVVCTSSNADRVFEWAMTGGTTPRSEDEDIKLLFLPDQHLGRNTAHAYGIDVEKHTTVWDPKAIELGDKLGGNTPERLLSAKVILWKGHCSVHQLFRPEHVRQIKEKDPTRKIIVHPECMKEVVDLADESGSTGKILKTIRESKPGDKWAVGTEIHLVQRIAAEMKERNVDVISLTPFQCLCTTMYRIDPVHFFWAIDNLAQGKVVNRIEVPGKIREYATLALGRMLELTAQPTVA